MFQNNEFELSIDQGCRKGGARKAWAPPIFGTIKTSAFSTNTQSRFASVDHTTQPGGMEETERCIDLIMGDSKSDMTSSRKNAKLKEVKSWTDDQWKESNDFVTSKVNKK